MGKAPDYKLVLAKRDNTKQSTRVGVGWTSDAHGGISISLNPGVVLSHRDCEDHYLTLWPEEEGPRRSGPTRRSPGLRTQPGITYEDSGHLEPPDDDDDDIPF